jgi:hypothetical protein
MPFDGGPGSNNFTINWGDGNEEVITTTTQYDHIYANPGTYTVTMTPNENGGIGRFNFVNLSSGGNTVWSDKLKSIEQWGNNEWSSLSWQNKFQYCENMIVNATDVPNTSLVTDFAQAFRDCESMTDLNMELWDMTNSITMSGMFANCLVFNPTHFDQLNIGPLMTDLSSMFNNCLVFDGDITNWDMSSVTSISAMLVNCLAFDESLAGWDVSNITNMTNFFVNGELSKANYNATLSSWSQQTVLPNINVNFGTSKYSDQASRDILTNAPNNWIITDGGFESDVYVKPLNANDDNIKIIPSRATYNVPSTGVFYYEITFDCPTSTLSRARGICGRTVAASDLSRYGLSIPANNDDLRVFFTNGVSYFVTDFVANYSGQKVNVKVEYDLDNNTYRCWVNNNLEIDQTGATKPDDSSTRNFWLGVYGDAGGITPLDNTTLDERIYSIDINGDFYPINEGSGFNIYLDGNVNSSVFFEGATSNPGGSTYWNSTVWGTI